MVFGVGVAATGGVVSLSQCSELNSKFWHTLQKSLQTIAVTRVPLPCPQALLHRLRASSHLQLLFSLPGFEGSVTEIEWHCYAVSLEGDVTVLCLPQGFFHRPTPPTHGGDHASSVAHSPLTSSSFSPCSSPPSTLLVDQPSQPPEPRPLWLPLVLLRLEHSHVLEPLSFTPSSTSLQSLVAGDWCLELDLTHPATPTCDASGCDLVSSVSSLHLSCYLSMLHTALISMISLSPADVSLALQNCQQSAVAVDATPLFSVLCPHVETSWRDKPGLDSFSLPLQTEQLCLLLSASLAKHEWSVYIQAKDTAEVDEEAGHGCGQSASFLNRVLQDQLGKLGFESVRMGKEGNLYWLDADRLQQLTRGLLVSGGVCTCGGMYIVGQVGVCVHVGACI